MCRETCRSRDRPPPEIRGGVKVVGPAIALVAIVRPSAAALADNKNLLTVMRFIPSINFIPEKTANPEYVACIRTPPNPGGTTQSNRNFLFFYNLPASPWIYVTAAHQTFLLYGEQRIH